MNARTTIRRILFIAIWLCIGCGMFTLLLAAISQKKKGKCSDYVITLKGNTNSLFIDKNDVEQLLKKNTGGELKGQPISAFNLQLLEEELEQNSWIRDAELYFDNKDVLHITVKEKEPVARIFTSSGNSFYIDSMGRSMPLSDKLSARVPVFTGFPGKKVLNAKDSLLLDQVRTTAGFIINDPFWMAQVAQVDITAARTFEMIPMLGNHTVILGNGENIEKKFRRLFVFYQQVLSKTGFDKYKLIDVQYAGQVVVSAQTRQTKVDSIQLRKNVEKLLKQHQESQDDTVTRTLPPPAKQIVLETDSVSLPMTVPETSALRTTDPNPVKTTSVSGLPKKQNEEMKKAKSDSIKPVEKKRQPKAVMPKRE